MKKLALLPLICAFACGSSSDSPDATPAMPDAGFQNVTLDPTNTNGMQFTTGPFDVPAGEEIQSCYFVAMPDLNNGQDYWIDHIRLGVNPGSHHTSVFRVKTIVNLDGDPGTVVTGINGQGECFKSGNWGDWPLVVNTQQSSAADPYLDWHLPAGVAYRFSPGEKLMVQVHYVNASTQSTPDEGDAVLDMYQSQLTNPMEMGTLFATQQNIRICQSNPTVSFSGTCAFQDGGQQIAAANGHFHSRGKEFDIYTWDGVSTTQPDTSQMFYQSLQWNDPPMDIYDPVNQPLFIPVKGGIWWTCDYQWQPPDPASGGCDAVNARDPEQANDCCYTFGPLVEIKASIATSSSITGQWPRTATSLASERAWIGHRPIYARDRSPLSRWLSQRQRCSRRHVDLLRLRGRHVRGAGSAGRRAHRRRHDRDSRQWRYRFAHLTAARWANHSRRGARTEPRHLRRRADRRPS